MLGLFSPAIACCWTAQCSGSCEGRQQRSREMEEQVLSTSHGLFLQQISSPKARRARRLQFNLWSFQEISASGSKSTAQLIRLSQKDTILLQSLKSKFQTNNISYGYCKRCVQSYRVVALLHQKWICRQVLYKSSSQIPLKCICRSM